MTADEARINDLSNLVIGCALAVAGTLGSGLVEKVYENALAHELRKSGLAVTQQRGVFAKYDDIVVGAYPTDLVVEDTVVVELKAVKVPDNTHFAQCRIILRQAAYACAIC